MNTWRHELGPALIDDTRPAASTPLLDVALLQVAIEHMAQGLLMLDAERRVTVVNGKFLKIYDLPGSVIKPGATAYDVVEQSVLLGNYGPVTVEAAWEAALKRLSGRAAWRIRQRLKSGLVIDIAYAPLPDGGWVTTHLDITAWQTAEDRLAQLAYHDPLTGLANRAQVQEHLSADLAAGRHFALLLVDLDRFKNVNDSLGHAFGDDLLCQVGGRIAGVSPPGAFVARLGGDEFLVQLPVSDPAESALDVVHRQATRLIDALCRPFLLAGHDARIGASIGIAFAPADGRNLDALMRCADVALYQAKSDGRGTARIYERASAPPARPRRERREVGAARAGG